MKYTQNITQIISRTVLGIVLIGLLFSCNEEWLEPDPLSFYTPENVYVDEEGFESLLVTMRENLKAEYYNLFAWSTAELVTSDLAVGGYGVDFTFLTPNGTPERYPVATMITQIYTFLKNPNVLISRIDNVEWQDESVRNRLLAEAFWHRAYLYYRLIHSYGDVPYIGEELRGAKLDFSTHSRWAILEKMISDMEWAVQWMPETAQIGVPTKYAGYHLLTKLYLANTNFDKAINAASQVINGPFALMTQRFGSWANDPARNVIWDLHRHDNIYHPQNTETILALISRPDAPEDARTDLAISGALVPHYHDVRDETGSGGIVFPSAMIDTLLRGQGVVANSRFYQFDIWKENGVDWSTTSDLRRADINWIEMSEIKYNRPGSPNFGEPIQQRWGAPSDTTLRWYSFPIYKTYNPANLVETRNNGGPGDAYLFRLAETYLLRAEAYFWMGSLNEAAQDLNVVRSRAQAPPISASDVTIDLIFDERGKELYFEAPRHSEMVRVSNIMAKLNIGGYSLENLGQSSWWYDKVIRDNEIYSKPEGSWWRGQTPRIFPYNIYWPIPQGIITANTQGQINQNFGYEGYQNNQPPLQTIE